MMWLKGIVRGFFLFVFLMCGCMRQVRLVGVLHAIADGQTTHCKVPLRVRSTFKNFGALHCRQSAFLALASCRCITLLLHTECELTIIYLMLIEGRVKFSLVHSEQ